MDSGLIWTIGGTFLGAAGFLFGLFESYRSRKLKQVVKIITKTYPGDLAKIQQSAYWAWSNTGAALELMLKFPDSEQKNSTVLRISNARADSAAAERMCSNLFGQLLGFQEAQFGTRDITHPEIDGLELCKLEAKRAKKDTSTL